MPSAQQRQPTTTSSFGVGKREGHDASRFYGRFPAPEINNNADIATPICRNKIWLGDARKMDLHGKIADNSVALVVTSPPYFVGKEYEKTAGEGHVPANYIDFLTMLEEVLANCVAKLEPGGRLAINVANLGRRPYRSLSADIINILQNRLKLLLRGEVIWRKAKGSGGNCAWGSFRQPTNPVLRDLTERVVIASKGRFDRAVPATERAALGMPSEATSTADEFMEATTDVWDIPAESAKRIGHPAPFPVELPQRLINLYTYKGDLVLDPFMGSGATAVAAIRNGRHFVGFDTDTDYVALAKQRIADERSQTALLNNFATQTTQEDQVIQNQIAQKGQTAQALAREHLEQSGFRNIKDKIKFPCGVEAHFAASNQRGQKFLFNVSGAFTVSQGLGLHRSDTLWEALGKAALLACSEVDYPLVLLTTNRPTEGSSGHRALATTTGADKLIYAVIEMFNSEDLALLAALAQGHPH
ncbi:MAG: site-specific DNA-methyltransferase [Acidimicrobiia bacterium]|nr:site-specific DNA-methyltransferase [Acidimicrobiia bacterium]MYC57286.1 site-specific DNA-methyltransferase [Acidimicrobiia bacterium]MYG94490.1 site-specific DNA-methyltransferase [Acidimicrobiia bacterium]MYI30924.1 site-specific DNA-methyltransferase [Acidimicrobiia bacterium]